MRLPYTTTIRDELLEIDVIPDLECQCEVSFFTDCGSIAFGVDAVYVDGKNLFRGTPFAQSLAAQIATEFTDELNKSGERRIRAIDLVMENA